MPGYYTYFMSSLPMLHFGEKPPFSFERLLEMCEGVVSDEDIAVVKASAPEAALPPAEKKWRNFDTALRNELVKVRAGSKKVDPLKYIRGEGYTEPSIAHIAVHAHRESSIIEAERILDQEKWRFLDEIGAGHYFDLDALVVYANKLLILERWERIKTWQNEQVI